MTRRYPRNAEIRRLIRRWQKRLRLEDWRVYYQTMKEIPDEDGDTLADVDIHVYRREAFLRLANGPKARKHRWYDPERSVVHELLHVHLASLGKASDRHDIAEEQMVHAVSLALVRKR